MRMLIHIAAQDRDKYITLKEISEQQNISIKYLEQIVILLSKKNLLLSTRGPSGGYKLSRNPEEITIYEILLASEGSMSPVSCLEGDDTTCERADICPTREIWKNLDKLIYDYLTSLTLADIINKENSKKSILNYSI